MSIQWKPSTGVQTTDARLLRASLQCLRYRDSEFFVCSQRGQPEAVGRGVVVAPTTAMAFNEWSGPEILQTRSR